jgi:hypothetical protein
MAGMSGLPPEADLPGQAKERPTVARLSRFRQALEIPDLIPTFEIGRWNRVRPAAFGPHAC